MPSRAAASRAKRSSGCSAPPGRSSTRSRLCSTINTARLSPEELHRRHLPVVSLFAPLIERGQKAGVFRSDLPVSWHLAVIRALAHTASFELQAGRIPEDQAEAAMLTTVLAAISKPR